MHDDGVMVVDELATQSVAIAHSPSAAPPTGETVLVAAPGRAWTGKRLVDIVLALAMLLAAAPLFLVLAIFIKLTSSGPVFFRQRRVGLGGSDFPMLKFRTMHVGSEQRLLADPALHELFLQGSHKIPSHLDPRVTGLGRILRRLSLDELPQLLNVLYGQMSMVGPRPVERTQLVRDYGEYQSVYIALRPGLTGLWQVSGRSTVLFPERAELDSHYLRFCGPWMDTKIILRTPRALVSGLGAD